MRIGATIPARGRDALERGFGAMARDLESAGFQSAWVGDHVAMPRTNISHYPFSPTGEMPWPATESWCDSVVAMATMAEATSTIRIGTGVMVVGLRNPVVLAKQLATIDVLSGGRLELGIGAGWLTEEFDIVGLDATNRGRRLDEAIAMIRRCWEGAPDGFEGEFYRLPDESLFHPVPAHDVPILVGGVSERAYERVVRHGAGWIGTTNLRDLQRGAVDPIARIGQLATEHGRDPSGIRHLVRVHTGPAFDVDGLVAAIPLLERAGVDELLVDIPWSGELDLGAWFEQLSSAAATAAR